MILTTSGSETVMEHDQDLAITLVTKPAHS